MVTLERKKQMSERASYLEVHVGCDIFRVSTKLRLYLKENILKAHCECIIM